MTDTISRSMAAAPPGMTLDQWARTTPEGRVFTLMRRLTEAQQEAFLGAGERLVEGMPAHVGSEGQ